MARPGKRRSSGQVPLNGLGSKKQQTVSPAKSSPRAIFMPDSKPTEKIGSDAYLLLERPTTKRKDETRRQEYSVYIPPFKSSNSQYGHDKFKKSSSKSVPPVYKVTSKKYQVLSDEESNDLVIQKENSLAVEEYDSDVKVKNYRSIKMHTNKVIFGDNEDSINGYELKFTVRTDLSHFVLTDKGKTVVDFNLLEAAESVHFAETKLLMIFRKPIEFNSRHYNALFIYIGRSHMVKLMTIWTHLTVVQRNQERLFNTTTTKSLTRLLKNQNLLNLLGLMGASSDTTGPRLGFQGKLLGSLERRIKPKIPGTPSRINIPENTLSSAPSKTSTATSTPHSFYGTSSSSARVTRSHSKNPDTDSNQTSESILIDDIEGRFSRRSGGGRKEVFKPSLIYKFPDNSSYKIRNVDFQCLYRGQWINDTLIDFFLKFFAEESFEAGTLKKENLHIFTTFFFTKLKSTPNYYENIKRWVSKIDFSDTKYVIVPINENLHWYCSIIVGVDKILKQEDKDSKCTIYVFDSLRQDHQSILKPLGTFLINYAKDKFGLDIEPDRIKLRTSAVPKQPNFNDCGVHVMYNVSKFFENPKECLNIWDSESDLRRHSLQQFFKKREREDMREKLRKILKQLQSTQEHREDDSDVEETQQGDADEDDIVYIDAEEFNELRNKVHGVKESSGEQSTDQLTNEECKTVEGEELKEKEKNDEGERFFSSQEENTRGKVDDGERTKELKGKLDPADTQMCEVPKSISEINDDTQVDTQINAQVDFQADAQPTELSSDIIQLDPSLSQNDKKEPYEEVPATQETQEDENTEISKHFGDEENPYSAANIDVDTKANPKEFEVTKVLESEKPKLEELRSAETIEDFYKEADEKVEILSSLVDSQDKKEKSEKIEDKEGSKSSQIECIELNDRDADSFSKGNEPDLKKLVLDTDASSPLSELSSSSPRAHNDIDGDYIMEGRLIPSEDTRTNAGRKSKYFNSELKSSPGESEFDLEVQDDTIPTSTKRSSRVIVRNREKSKEPDLPEPEHVLIESDQEITPPFDTSTIKDTSLAESDATTGVKKPIREIGSRRLQKTTREVVPVEDEPSYREDSLAERPSERSRQRET